MASNESTNPFDDGFTQSPAASPPGYAPASASSPPPATTSSTMSDMFQSAAGPVMAAAAGAMLDGSSSVGGRPMTGFGNTVPDSGIGGHHLSDTLDESVWETLRRDLVQVGRKMWQVLLPRDKNDVLKDWDLWGPLLLCLSLAIMLSVTAPTDQAAVVFTGVFVIIWCGAGVVTLNAKLLGGQLSFFQSVCVLGYCCLPLVLAALICMFVPLVPARIAVVVGAFVWSTWAALAFLANVRLQHRRALAVYPIVLFYFVLGWIVLISRSVLG